MASNATANAIAKGAIEPGCAKVDPILIADNVTRQFGGLKAVDVAQLMGKGVQVETASVVPEQAQIEINSGE